MLCISAPISHSGTLLSGVNFSIFSPNLSKFSLSLHFRVEKCLSHRGLRISHSKTTVFYFSSLFISDVSCCSLTLLPQFIKVQWTKENNLKNHLNYISNMPFYHLSKTSHTRKDFKIFSNHVHLRLASILFPCSENSSGFSEAPKHFAVKYFRHHLFLGDRNHLDLLPTPLHSGNLRISSSHPFQGYISIMQAKSRQILFRFSLISYDYL